MYQTMAGGALLLIVLVILLIIFMCLYYLWAKTKQLEELAKKSSKPVVQVTGTGNIFGYSGSSLYDVLKNQTETPERNEEIKKSYAFYLSRHLEAVIEQGIIDQKKATSIELESEMAVGGTRGEVLSWLPIGMLGKFYQFGRNLSRDDHDEEEKKELSEQLQALVSEVLSSVNMQNYSARMSGLISGKYI
jgi:hypothetical protein